MSQPTPSLVRIMEVDASHSGQRLDNFLLTKLKGVPRSHIYRMVRTGEVRINKSRVRPSYRLQQGDRIRIPPLRLPSAKPGPSVSGRLDLAARIVFEDDHLIVIDKPAGLAVHAGSGVYVGLIDYLRGARVDRFLELVHRLDRETSGCLLLAKNRNALTRLHRDLREKLSRSNRVKRRYVALVKGTWSGGDRDITAPLRKNVARFGQRIVAVDATGRDAKSRFRPLSQYRRATLMEILLYTGRTHQARVHAAEVDHPIAGDSKYGDPAFNAELRELGLNRLFLHAASISFLHPVTGTRLTVETPLPEPLLACLRNL